VFVDGPKRDLNCAGVRAAWRELTSVRSRPPLRGARTRVMVIGRAAIGPRSRAPLTCHAVVPGTTARAEGTATVAAAASDRAVLGQSGESASGSSWAAIG